MKLVFQSLAIISEWELAATDLIYDETNKVDFRAGLLITEQRKNNKLLLLTVDIRRVCFNFDRQLFVAQTTQEFVFDTQTKVIQPLFINELIKRAAACSDLIVMKKAIELHKETHLPIFAPHYINDASIKPLIKKAIESYMSTLG